MIQRIGRSCEEAVPELVVIDDAVAVLVAAVDYLVDRLAVQWTHAVVYIVEALLAKS